MSNYSEKIKNLINKLNNNLYEREQVIKYCVLALLSGESIFLLGPPGVAKSLIARKFKSVISDADYFEYLMNRFSTPEEIFGPISLRKLDEDKYERKIDGYLPTATIGFLDEIWKASPSIQNTLLTIINEKIFKNGTGTINVPMQLLIAASNELPAENEGLEALYDRFIIRFYVDNIVNKRKFRLMLDSDHQQAENISDEEKLTLQEIHEIKTEANKIGMDDNTMTFINSLKEKIDSTMVEQAPYISDRRWKKIAGIFKTSAFISNRNQISFPDWLLVQHLLWETPDQHEQLKKIIFEVWEDAISEIYKLDSKKNLQILDGLEKRLNIAYQDNELPYIINIWSMGAKEEYYVYKCEMDAEISYIAFKVKEKFNLSSSSSKYSYYYYGDISKTMPVKDVLKHLADDFNRIEIHSLFVTQQKDCVRVSFSKYTKLTYQELIKDEAEIAKITTELLDFSLTSMIMLNKRNSIETELKLIECPLVHDYTLNLNNLLQDIDEQIKAIKTKKSALDSRIKKIMNK